jgi:very-short-patch-repair endonuclease
VETDGDTWHANPVKAAEDNVRDNALEVHGWSLLRFTTAQIVERLNEYCIPKIVEKINALGGADEGGQIARRVELPDGARMIQKGLFDGF